MMISQKHIFIMYTFPDTDVTAILLNPLEHILAHIQNHNMLVKSFDSVPFSSHLNNVITPQEKSYKRLVHTCSSPAQ